MNEPILTEGLSDVPWPTSDDRVRVPDTSMLPGAGQTGPALTDAPDADLAAARDADGDGAPQAWVDALRTAVRSNPLAAIAAAVALGAVLVRLTRIAR